MPIFLVLLVITQLVVSVIFILAHEVIQVDSNEISISSIHHESDSIKQSSDLLEILEETEEEKQLVEFFNYSLIKATTKNKFNYSNLESNSFTFTIFSPPERSI